MCQDNCIATLCPRTCGLCPLKCYSCNHVDHPSDCHQIELCSNISMVCNDLYGAVTNPTQSRVRRDVDLIGGCCSSDLCNKYNEPDKIPAPTILPALTCYECASVDLPRHCRNRVMCDGHKESCIAVESHVFNFKEGYKLGCVAKQNCKDLLAMNIEGVCCDNNFCNGNYVPTTTLVPPTSTVVSTTASKQSQLGLPTANRYWLDAYRNSSSFSGPWHWRSTGDILRRQTYSHWRPGSHDQTKPDGEHCASIGKAESGDSDNGYYWDRRSCTFHAPAICEYPLGHEP
ncbi:unnamed protein product [Mytilus coruscus]|uniref:C-type lectin domain-containing protein n=1 Tax=Mytilus coruscus TaxID=42192 RepID=A0A6J8C386_MYTCO|nr:unnamed protein product [Mytilus coruscus]